jgi:hypothetical protein
MSEETLPKKENKRNWKCEFYIPGKVDCDFKFGAKQQKRDGSDCEGDCGSCRYFVDMDKRLETLANPQKKDDRRPSQGYSPSAQPYTPSPNLNNYNQSQNIEKKLVPTHLQPLKANEKSAKKPFWKR